MPRNSEPAEPIRYTRLWLNDATGQALRNGLTLLGVTAPERMEGGVALIRTVGTLR